jgi:hypothetical protein
MAGSKKTLFNELWLDAIIHPEFAGWLQKHPKSTQDAFCNGCKTVIHLSNMGRQAISSHAKSVKHLKFVESSMRQQSNLSSYLKPPVHKDESLSSTSLVTAVVGSESQVVVSTTANEPSGSQPNASAGDATTKLGGIYGFVANDQVTRAEIVWALKVVTSHFSMNASRDMKDVFRMMFPDSEIAKKITIGATKMAYMISFGLAPYYHSQLVRSVQKCNRFVICFDEAMNRIAQRGQMDVVIRYWDDGKNEVSSRFFGSAFMGHATAQCILDSFKETLNEVSLSSLLQVSMDGPAVNWKFLDLLSKNLSDDMNTNQLINMGSCGLHVVHGAIQTGHKASGWEVSCGLRAMYGLFKDSPARRADYTEITGSKTFPKKFCTVRWVENVTVAERALEVMPDVKKYVKEAKKLPNTVTCNNVKKLCGDNMGVAKISFFASVSAVCQPFLKAFQTPSPMAPFLYDDISHLLRTLMTRFVKKSILTEAKTTSHLLKIDVSSKDIRCNYKEVDIGVAANKALAQTSVSDKDRLSFRMQCLEFLSSTTAKILERSPVQYKIVRAISCFVPSTICNNRVLAQSRMGDLVQILYNTNHITALTADNSKMQFSNLCDLASRELQQQFQEYSRGNERLDKFYFHILGLNPDFSDLFSIVRLVLTLSHGNASVESGFSVNADMLVENLQEESLVAQRTVYDSVQASGGWKDVQIDKSLLQFVRGAHRRYQEALECKRKAASEENKKAATKRRATEEIKALMEKKKKFAASAAQESHKLDMQIAELDKMKK